MCICVCVCLMLCTGSECSVQINNAVPAATPDFNANVVSDDGASTTRVTRGVQTLPRSAHSSRISSTYHAGAGGSLTRPRPAIVDKQVRFSSWDIVSLLKHLEMKSLDNSWFTCKIRSHAYTVASMINSLSSRANISFYARSTVVHGSESIA